MYTETNSRTTSSKNSPKKNGFMRSPYLANFTKRMRAQKLYMDARTLGAGPHTEARTKAQHV